MSNENVDLYNKLSKFIDDSNKKQTNELKGEISIELSELKKNIAEIKETLNNEENKRQKLESRQNNILENRINYIEKVARKNNSVIFGLNFPHDKPLANFVIEQLNLLLNVELTTSSLNNVYHIGKPQQNQPLVVQFLSFLTKIQVLRACKALKGTGISISEDLTKKERETRRSLVQYQKEAHAKGYKTFIKGNLLIVNGEEYTLEQFEKENVIQKGVEETEDIEESAEENKTVENQSKTKLPTDTKSKKRKAEGDSRLTRNNKKTHQRVLGSENHV